jgi:O-antigen biosynthesis protein
MSRVASDGKHFCVDGHRFHFRGVTYGTFAPRQDGALFPAGDVIKRDLGAMAERGFTVVRTYTAPPPDLLQWAQEFQLRLLAGVFFPDWRYLVGASRADERAAARAAREQVRAAARALADEAAVVGLCVANEIPADVVRWVGPERVGRLIGDLVDVVHQEDPQRLVTYANYPTAEYLPLPSLDFLTFNVFLERRQDLRRYLNRLHTLAEDRPLVLGEIGMDAGTAPAGVERQAEALDWQLATAVERGVAGTCIFSWTDEWAVGGNDVQGWHFGLTQHDRTPRSALDVAERWNRRTVADLDRDWPPITVVVCAYNAEATIDECLRHLCASTYPDLEILVVDDGSTDGTAAIARRHRRARVVTVPHAGLSVARNEGLARATGEIVAYLDSDAYPTPEWLHYLALAFDASDVAGAGGPNIPPRDDPEGAQVVAQSPGGPVHVLVADDRAEHVPGCNMAFRREALLAVGGFDPIYTSAGDDVDVCWKVLDRGCKIGFHPAALVWHHRRPGLAPYLRQQRGYGRAEALVAARHPERFSASGSARWAGRIYRPGRASGRQRIYHGPYGTAAYQSVYRSGGHGLDLAHQLGLPIALLLLVLAPLGLLAPELTVPAVGGLGFVAVLGAVDAARAVPPRTTRRQRLRFRVSVAVHHLLQPLYRHAGRLHAAPAARVDACPVEPLPAAVQRLPGGVAVHRLERGRGDFAADVVALLRDAGFRVRVSQGWEPYDARVGASALMHAQLVSSAHPEGVVQVRLKPRVSTGRIAAVGLAGAALATVSAVSGAVLLAGAVLDVLSGLVRVRTATRRVLWGGGP